MTNLPNEELYARIRTSNGDNRINTENSTINKHSSSSGKSATSSSVGGRGGRRRKPRLIENDKESSVKEENLTNSITIESGTTENGVDDDTKNDDDEPSYVSSLGTNSISENYEKLKKIIVNTNENRNSNLSEIISPSYRISIGDSSIKPFTMEHLSLSSNKVEDLSSSSKRNNLVNLTNSLGKTDSYSDTSSCIESLSTQINNYDEMKTSSNKQFSSISSANSKSHQKERTKKRVKKKKSIDNLEEILTQSDLELDKDIRHLTFQSKSNNLKEKMESLKVEENEKDLALATENQNEFDPIHLTLSKDTQLKNKYLRALLYLKMLNVDDDNGNERNTSSNQSNHLARKKTLEKGFRSKTSFHLASYLQKDRNDSNMGRNDGNLLRIMENNQLDGMGDIEEYNAINRQILTSRTTTTSYSHPISTPVMSRSIDSAPYLSGHTTFIPSSKENEQKKINDFNYNYLQDNKNRQVNNNLLLARRREEEEESERKRREALLAQYQDREQMLLNKLDDLERRLRESELDKDSLRILQNELDTYKSEIQRLNGEIDRLKQQGVALNRNNYTYIHERWDRLANHVRHQLQRQTSNSVVANSEFLKMEPMNLEAVCVPIVQDGAVETVRSTTTTQRLGGGVISPRMDTTSLYQQDVYEPTIPWNVGLPQLFQQIIHISGDGSTSTMRTVGPGGVQNLANIPNLNTIPQPAGATVPLYQTHQSNNGAYTSGQSSNLVDINVHATGNDASATAHTLGNAVPQSTSNYQVKENGSVSLNANYNTKIGSDNIDATDFIRCVDKLRLYIIFVRQSLDTLNATAELQDLPVQDNKFRQIEESMKSLEPAVKKAQDRGVQLLSYRERMRETVEEDDETKRLRATLDELGNAWQKIHQDFTSKYSTWLQNVDKVKIFHDDYKDLSNWFNNSTGILNANPSNTSSQKQVKDEMNSKSSQYERLQQVGKEVMKKSSPTDATLILERMKSIEARWLQLQSLLMNVPSTKTAFQTTNNQSYQQPINSLNNNIPSATLAKDIDQIETFMAETERILRRRAPAVQ
ncbi:hypothetical protein SNEBB_005009 [Seison nebaliae]|nr:hypothetical protein SNEBB_005009 [Seison nebaliae]